ncbi:MULTISPECIES: enoyl-CoA hydratase/isomerase family protein [unclassified Limnohabitans]|uniref:enoyl-CoA hydratase/isomerase family protein n=1 Tax=unclassified Limnohabitans TaxID=2626134 RepID=UPI000AFF41CA|nr:MULTISPECIES: enoyl-CoA hydratase-related protein [unclassified Limnohabitans]PUE10688.1 crotonase [Limnohabitans sp. WS1]
MTNPKLLCKIHDGTMILSLNRPEKLNAIDNELSHELLEALHLANEDRSVKVVLLRGNGKAFCAGRDIAAAPTEEDLTSVQAVAQAIVGLSKPVVAAVHGWTVGAGLEWMLNADVVIAASSARFKLPEASLGVFVTGGLIATLPAYVGVARAKALMLLGDEFSAEDAQSWGLIWRVVEPEELEPESERITQKLASLKPDLAARFKRALNEVGLHKFHQTIDIENEAHRAVVVSEPNAAGS